MIHSRHAHSFDKIIKWKQEVDEQYKQLMGADGRQAQSNQARTTSRRHTWCDSSSDSRSDSTGRASGVSLLQHPAGDGNPAENSHAGLLAEDVQAR